MSGNSLSAVLLVVIANLVLSSQQQVKFEELPKKIDVGLPKPLSAQLEFLYDNVYRITVPDLEGKFFVQEVEEVKPNEFLARNKPEHVNLGTPNIQVETKNTGPNSYHTRYSLIMRANRG